MVVQGSYFVNRLSIALITLGLQGQRIQPFTVREQPFTVKKIFLIPIKKTDTVQMWRACQDWNNLRSPFRPSLVPCYRGAHCGHDLGPPEQHTPDTGKKSSIFHADLLSHHFGNISLVICKLLGKYICEYEAFLISAVNPASASLCLHWERMHNPQVCLCSTSGSVSPSFQKKKNDFPEITCSISAYWLIAWLKLRFTFRIFFFFFMEFS